MKLGPGHEMECPKCGTVYPQKPGDHGHLDDHPDGYRFMSKDAITVEAVELKKGSSSFEVGSGSEAIPGDVGLKG